MYTTVHGTMLLSLRKGLSPALHKMSELLSYRGDKRHARQQAGGFYSFIFIPLSIGAGFQCLHMTQSRERVFFVL
jgi:hypothetical protein